MLHEDVASVLEELYAGRTDKVAVQLAHHYDLARLDDEGRARLICRPAAAPGDVRKPRSAGPRHSAGSTASTGRARPIGTPALLLDLHLLQAEALRHDGHFVECMVAFRQAADLAIAFGAPRGARPGGARLRRAAVALQPRRAYANTLLERALERIGPDDSVLRVYLLAHLARGSQGSMPARGAAWRCSTRPSAMARRLDDPRALVESLRLRVSVDRTPERIRWRIETHRRDAATGASVSATSGC